MRARRPPSKPTLRSSASKAQGAGRTWGPYGKNVPDGDVRWRVLDDVWMHRAGLSFGLLSPLAQLQVGPSTATEDIGEIAVLQDEGDLVLRPNRLDIQNLGLRWTRNGAGGYDVRKIDCGVPDEPRQPIHARR